MTPLEALDIAKTRITQTLATGKLWLDLGDLPLAEIPDTIWLLSHLEILSLGAIAIDEKGERKETRSHPRPRFTCIGLLKALTSLTHLSLVSCYGVEDLEPLSRMRKLTHLDLSTTGVKSLEPLKDLPLTHLYLSGCVGVENFGPLSRMRKLTNLDLSYTDIRSLEPLKDLPHIRCLSLFDCYCVEDLEPLSLMSDLTDLDLRHTGVKSLEPLKDLPLPRLSLFGCKGVENLEPLSLMRSLTELDLCHTGVHCIQPIRSLMDGLDSLFLYGCDIKDLPTYLVAETDFENVAEMVRDYYRDLGNDTSEDRECKLLVVGNGRAGKTSLVRFLRDKPHQPGEPPTHAIQLEPWFWPVKFKDTHAGEKVRINVWDFGGQEIYHYAHRLFFQIGAVYLVLWDPWTDEQPRGQQALQAGEKKRPLQYWIDQIRSIDRKARILVVRSQADLFPVSADPNWKDELPGYQKDINDGSIQIVRLSATQRVSPAWERDREILRSWLREEFKRVLGGAAKRRESEGRLRVKQQIRIRQEANNDVARANEAAKAAHADQNTPPPRQHLRDATMTQEEFRGLVAKHGPQGANPHSVLEWLHRTGVVFKNETVFQNRIILDQRWAIDGIYALFDPRNTEAQWQTAEGTFTQSQLAEWVWKKEGYLPEELELFLSFMLACGLCFLRISQEDSGVGEPVYVAPDRLPSEGILKLDRDESRGQAANDALSPVIARDRFLGEGVARAMVIAIAQRWPSARLWRWGAQFTDYYESATAEVSWCADRDQFGGAITVSVWGPEASGFLRTIVDLIRDLPGFPQGVEFKHRSEVRQTPSPCSPPTEAFHQGSAEALPDAASQSADCETPGKLESIEPLPVDSTGQSASIPDPTAAKRISRLIALAEVCLSWPTDEFTGDKLLKELRKKPDQKRAAKSTLELDLTELANRCEPQHFVDGRGSGRKPRRFAPGAKERLRQVIENLRRQLRLVSPEPA